MKSHQGDYDVFYRQKVTASHPYLFNVTDHRLCQCDTFSRSADAVFELSMRFAEPFTQSGKSPEAKLEAERLMFLELTQGRMLFLISDSYILNFYFVQSVSGEIPRTSRYSSI